MMTNHFTKNKQTGFTLIEVLISLIILAIGLLGLSSLQLTALQRNTSAYNRSLATSLAYDIADRMRANKGATNGDAYLTAIGDGPSGATSCIDNGCDAAGLAAYDLDEWKCQLGSHNDDDACDPGGTGTRLQGSLPNGVGQITRDGANFIITIMWDDERNGVAVNAGNCGVDPETNATCFSVEFEPPTIPATLL